MISLDILLSLAVVLLGLALFGSAVAVERFVFYRQMPYEIAKGKLAGVFELNHTPSMLLPPKD